MSKNTKKFIIILLLLVVGYFYDSLGNDLTSGDKKVFKDNENDVQLKVDGSLNVYYLDVGQADSILLENNGSYMLIDAGNNNDGVNLVKYFKDMGISEFEYVIATHAHEDHIGGMDDILNSFSVKNFYMPDVVSTSKTFEDVIIALEDKNMVFDTPEIGYKFTFGGSDFEVLHVGVEGEDLNDTSIVVRGVYGDNSFLFMGDATSNVEKKILNKNIDSDVLKVGHHGSRYSSMISFLNKVSPSYSIISVGDDNSYGHPHSPTISNLERVGSKVYRTDIDGTVVVVSDGKEISIKTMDTNLNG